MSKTRSVFFIAVTALLVATPAVGQLANFPVLALPGSNPDGVTTIGAGWGRGLSDTSGKLNSFVAGAARAQQSVSFGVLGSWVAKRQPADSSGAFMLGGSVAYNLPQAVNTETINFALQGGIEWMSLDSTATTAKTTLIYVPIGLSVRGNLSTGSLDIPVWIMPRWQWTRSSPSGGTSNTENNFGLSSGVSGVMESGFGVGLSVDWSRQDDGTGTAKENHWLFGAAAFYRL